MNLACFSEFIIESMNDLDANILAIYSLRSCDIISQKFDCDILQAKRYDINSFSRPEGTYRIRQDISHSKVYRKFRQEFISLISSSMKSLYHIKQKMTTI